MSAGLVFLAAFPLMNVVGVHPFGARAVWIWLVGFAVGFALPDWMLEGRLERRRTTLLMELPTVLDLLAIAATGALTVRGLGCAMVQSRRCGQTGRR